VISVGCERFVRGEVGVRVETKKVKLGVLRARHQPGLPLIDDQPCAELVFTGRHSILRYWSDVTNGYLDFTDGAILPWVDITYTPPAADGTGGDGRVELMAKAFEASQRLTGDSLDRYDGFIVFIYPGQLVQVHPGSGLSGPPYTFVNLDGGADHVGGHGRLGACLTVIPSTFVFFCHEVGHVLGFHHTFGLLNNGIEYDPGPPFASSPNYGDPYDIMSSDSFGSFNADPTLPKWFGSPRFQGPVPAGWPGQGAATMGCPPALAHVHLWDAKAFAPQALQAMTWPTSGQVLRARIGAAWTTTPHPQLLILEPDPPHPDGQFRCYVEYRIDQGWDAGLVRHGPNLSRTGVVATRSTRRWMTGPHASLAGTAAMSPCLWGTTPTSPRRGRRWSCGWLGSAHERSSSTSRSRRRRRGLSP
jgi:hypothetical protein